MQELNSKDWREKASSDPNAVILDVRTDEEYEEGIIAGAIQIDILNPGEFMQKAQELDPSKSYYVYCRAGGRSAQACAVLNSLGINETYNLVGGISEWDGPIEK
jgi:rhodanese-related sulfurtransferase